MLLLKIVFLGFLSSTALGASQPRSFPVQVGGEPELDACGGIGAVANLKPVPGNFLAVRSAPSSAAKLTDKLPLDFKFFICSESEDGEWIGIVYKPKGESQLDCGVSSPINPKQPYAGPCASGWVFRKFVDFVAG